MRKIIFSLAVSILALGGSISEDGMTDLVFSSFQFEDVPIWIGDQRSGQGLF